MISHLTTSIIPESPPVFLFTKIPRTIVIGLSTLGINILKDAVTKIKTIEPRLLSLSAFLIVGNQARWESFDQDGLLNLHVPELLGGNDRRAIYQASIENEEQGIQAVLDGYKRILNAINVTQLLESGYEPESRIEVYVIGDLGDPWCNAALIPVIETVDRALGIEDTIVINLLLSLGHLSDLPLSNHERAQAYAVLKELNYLLSPIGHESFRLAYGVSRCYLVDSIGPNRTVFNATQVSEVMSRSLALHFLPGPRSSNSAEMLFGKRSEWDSSQPPNAGICHGIGYSALSFPLSQIVDYCAIKEGERLISDALCGYDDLEAILRSEDEERANNLITEFMMKIGPENILSRLLEPRQQVAGWSNEQGYLDAEPLRKVIHRLRELTVLDENMNRPVLQQRIFQNAEDARREIIQQIDRTVDDMVQHHLRGVRVAKAFLDKLDRRLQEWYQVPATGIQPMTFETEDRMLKEALIAWPKEQMVVLRCIILLSLAFLWMISFSWVGLIIGSILVIWTIGWATWGLVFARRTVCRARDAYYQAILKRRTQLGNLFAMESRRLIYLGLHRYIVGEDEDHPGKEIKALRGWFDRLKRAGQSNQFKEPLTQAANNRSIIERSLAAGSDYLKRFDRLVGQKPIETLVAEYLGNAGNAFGWQKGRLPWRNPGFNAEIVAGDVIRFCHTLYEEQFSTKSEEMDIEAELVALSSETKKTLGQVVEELHEYSSARIRARSGTQLRLRTNSKRLLLVHDAQNSILEREAKRMGFGLMSSGDKSHIFALQIGPPHVIGDLRLARYFSPAYRVFEPKRDLHISDECLNWHNPA